MEIDENMRKTAHGLADSIKDTVNALEQGAKDGARIDTSKGSLIEELSKINNYFNDSKQSKANDDFVKDVILFAQLQVEAAKRFFDNSGNEATKILEQSQYWNSAKPYFYVIAINYIGYISDNYQAFVNMLKVTKESCPEYIDEMLKELIEAAKNDSQPISDIKLTHFLAIYATITDTCKFKGLEPTEDNILGVNVELTDGVPKKIKGTVTKNIVEPIKYSPKYQYPFDRISNDIIKKANEAFKGNGAVEIVKNGNKNDAIMLYFRFDAAIKKMGLENILTNFDKFVYMAICSIYDDSGSNKPIWVNATQIYKKLYGEDARPNPKAIAAIRMSVSKMRLINVTANNEREIAEQIKEKKTTYKSFITNEVFFLPVEISEETFYYGNVSSTVNFKILTMPLLGDIAKSRKQVFTFERPILQEIGLRATEQNLAIIDYLVRRAAQFNTDGNGKILTSSFFEACGITTQKQRNRAFEKAEKVLNYLYDAGKIEEKEVRNDCFLISKKAKANYERTHTCKPATKSKATVKNISRKKG